MICKWWRYKTINWVKASQGEQFIITRVFLFPRTWCSRITVKTSHCTQGGQSLTKLNCIIYALWMCFAWLKETINSQRGYFVLTSYYKSFFYAQNYCQYKGNLKILFCAVQYENTNKVNITDSIQGWVRLRRVKTDCVYYYTVYQFVGLYLASHMWLYIYSSIYILAHFF